MADGERTPVQPNLREDAAKLREARPGAVGASPNAAGEPPAWRVWGRNLGIAAAAGLFLAFSGAMGTADVPLAQRLLYWTPLMLLGALVGHGASVVISRFPGARDNVWLFGALLAVAIALPFTVVVWGYTSLMFGAFAVAALPSLFGGVLLISAAMTANMILANLPGRVTHAAAGADAPGGVRFLERLPPKLKGAAIYAVSAEDHYLRLHTSKGSDLILMRLAEAISELEGLEGAQTHRSWWVAKDAVESARRDGDRVTLALKGGAEAPVSRPNIKPLREAGWF
jgi:DNA-binding LytR/AlgR family response regulator